MRFNLIHRPRALQAGTMSRMSSSRTKKINDRHKRLSVNTPREGVLNPVRLGIVGHMPIPARCLKAQLRQS